MTARSGTLPGAQEAHVVDLRSEAVAPLHPLVRAALSDAPEGCDSYDEDPSVHELESRLASMFGMGCALFVPTGRMANAIAVGALGGGTGTEVLLDADAHMARSEYALITRLWGTMTRTFSSDGGRARPGDVLPLLGCLENTTVRTSLVCVEDTHSARGGAAQDLGAIRELAGILAGRDISLYCDGARLWYANLAHRVPWTTYGSLYDGLAVSLVKGVGAPAGAAVMLRDCQRPRLRELRRMLGGAWVRPAPLARAALCALDVCLPGLERDRAHAERLAAALRSSLPGLNVRQETNVVAFDVPDTAEYFEKCRAVGVLVFRYTPTRIRAVLHRGITAGAVDRAASVLAGVFCSLAEEGGYL